MSHSLPPVNVTSACTQMGNTGVCWYSMYIRKIDVSQRPGIFVQLIYQFTAFFMQKVFFHTSFRIIFLCYILCFKITN